PLAEFDTTMPYSSLGNKLVFEGGFSSNWRYNNNYSKTFVKYTGNCNAGRRICIRMPGRCHNLKLVCSASI
ncbi:hypothetical protein ACFLYK_03870, partial [Candidatus Cloacimonadota bacterium]